MKRRDRRALARQQGVPFAPLAGSAKPFKAAVAVAVKLEAALKVEDPAHRALAISALQPPRSRGHGGKRRVRNRTVLGRAMADRSRYVPRVEEAKHRRNRLLGRMSQYLALGA